MFDQDSRYVGVAQSVYIDRHGREQEVVAARPAQPGALRGWHRKRQDERVDHLAWRYLRNATAFWRIVDINPVFTADALREAERIAIPRRR